MFGNEKTLQAWKAAVGKRVLVKRVGHYHEPFEARVLEFSRDAAAIRLKHEGPIETFEAPFWRLIDGYKLLDVLPEETR